MHLVEAINFAEEREAKHGVPFDDRVELQQTLAIIYQKQKKWAEARKVLHGLLQEPKDVQAELDVEKALRRASQYFLLATIYHEMYLAQPGEQNPSEAADLKSAEKYANLAFSKRFKLHKLRNQRVDQRDPGLLDAVQILIQIYEAQGRTVVAESYNRQFLSNHTLSSPLPDDLLQTLSISTGSDFEMVETEDLLITAIKQGDQSHIQNLLRTADVNKCTKGKTPLIYAVEQADEVTVRKLLDQGAEINAKMESGATALHHAVARGNVRMARLLLELDADIEAKDKNLATPLVKAVEQNQGLVVSYLLGQGADRHVKDRAGWTPLHHAAYNGTVDGAVDVLNYLLYPSEEASVNETCPARKTALHYCAELTVTESAKVLLTHGADIDALDANKRSPLFFAVQKPFNAERERFVSLLLDKVAKIPAHLPPRHRDYPALQNHLSKAHASDSSSTRRRESASTIASSGTSRSLWSRRFSSNREQT